MNLIFGLFNVFAKLYKMNRIVHQNMFENLELTGGETKPPPRLLYTGDIKKFLPWVAGGRKCHRIEIKKNGGKNISNIPSQQG